MSMVASFVTLAVIKLNKISSLPFHRQIYESLRQGILEGRLKPGSRLPSSRALATELGLSRNTISRAFEQLIDEGYLESKVGSGTTVTKSLPDELLKANQQDRGLKTVEQQTARLSERGRAILKTLNPAETANPFYWQISKATALSPSVPALDAFPMKLWEKTLLGAWRSLAPEDLSYQPAMAMGYLALREALAEYTQSARGVRCSAEQIVITNGTQEALSLISNLLLERHDKVWVENPSYQGIHVALKAALATIIPVPVDHEGLVVSEGIRRSHDARMVYVAPSHQYPLGVSMSLRRRLQLLNWAQEQNVWLIEDDYDSEFRYAGYPLEALQGLDQTGRVIYIGTFSKVLFPALRLGYMVVPESLIEPIRAARAHIDRGLNLVTQVALTNFIEQGHFVRHIRRMRGLYAQRQAYLVEQLKALKDKLSVEPQEAGLHLIAYLNKNQNDKTISRQLREKGVLAPALSAYALEPLERQGLLLGFTAPEAQMREAVLKMKDVL